jgi:3'-phosphoadenosine 5'-phosphosulfate sulfotransferase (PAPS reductase)/FAD synthetase
MAMGFFRDGEKRVLARGEMKRILILEPASKMIEDGHDAAFIGLRADESKARAMHLRTHGPIHRMADTGVLHVNPLAWWTSRDVWTYLVSRDVPWAPVYDKRWPGGREELRVSAFCLGNNLASGRWEFLRRYYPKTWRDFVQQFPGARDF